MWQTTFGPETTLFIDGANRELQESVIGGLATLRERSGGAYRSRSNLTKGFPTVLPDAVVHDANRW